MGLPATRSTTRASKGGDHDQLLVARTLAGDQDAFRQLVVSHRRLIDAACSSVCSTTVDREDAAQLAIVDIWKGLQTFRGEAKVSTWMYRVSRNAALRHLHSESGKETEILDDDFDVAASQDDWQAVSATRDIVRRAIAGLPEDQRQALLLHTQAGRSIRDIATTMLAAEGTVKAWIHRARAEILRQLDARED